MSSRSAPEAEAASAPADLARQAAADVLRPLARLCIGHGLPFADVETLLKQAYVAAAREAQAAAGASSQRDVSRVAVATGLHRREVARLDALAEPRAPRRPAPAHQVYMRWIGDRAYRHANGRLRRLPRVGDAPSFEALAASVTRHVHARSLLDELLRLGLVELADGGETVVLVRESVVPAPGSARLYELLGANVGDHLAAATANVQARARGDDAPFPEQALFLHTVSDDAARAAHALVREHWRRMLETLAPQLQALLDEDDRAGRPTPRRLRLGVYSYDEAPPARGEDDDDSTR